MDHLSRVTAQSARNKMNSQNLAICFAPVLMLDFSQGQPVATNISEPIQILKYLIEIWPKSQAGLWNPTGPSMEIISPRLIASQDRGRAENWWPQVRQETPDNKSGLVGVPGNVVTPPEKSFFFQN